MRSLCANLLVSNAEHSKNYWHSAKFGERLEHRDDNFGWLSTVCDIESCNLKNALFPSSLFIRQQFTGEIIKMRREIVRQRTDQTKKKNHEAKK